MVCSLEPNSWRTGSRLQTQAECLCCSRLEIKSLLRKSVMLVPTFNSLGKTCVTMESCLLSKETWYQDILVRAVSGYCDPAKWMHELSHQDRRWKESHTPPQTSSPSSPGKHHLFRALLKTAKGTTLSLSLEISPPHQALCCLLPWVYLNLGCFKWPCPHRLRCLNTWI